MPPPAEALTGWRCRHTLRGGRGLCCRIHFSNGRGRPGGRSFGPPYMGATFTDCANFFGGENCKFISYKG